MSDDDALLARTGFAGASTIFDGRFGFFELYQPNVSDAAVLLLDLERRSAAKR